MQEKDLKKFEKSQDKLKTRIEAHKAEIKNATPITKRLLAKAKAEKDPTKKELINGKIEAQKAYLQGLKEKVQTLEEELQQKEQEFIQQNPELEKYMLYEQGMFFDKKISEAKEQKTKLQKVKSFLSNETIRKKTDQFLKQRKELEELEENAKKHNAPIDLTVAKAKLAKLAQEITVELEKENKKRPMGERVSKEDFGKVIDGLTFDTDATTSLQNEIYRVNKKIDYRTKALANVEQKGMEKGVRFTGFRNETTSVRRSPAPVAVLRPWRGNFWYNITHLGERRQIREQQERAEQEARARNSIPEYSPEQHNELGFKANLVVNKMITRNRSKDQAKVRKADEKIKKDEEPEL